MSEDLKAKVESLLGIPVGASTESSKAVTGEEYVILCSGGMKLEGNSMPAWYATPDLAEHAYLQVVRQYGDAKGDGVLYWREPPEVESQTFVCGNWDVDLYYVYSRLLISAKAPEVRPGPEIRYEESRIVMDGLSYRPLTIIEASKQWLRIAEERGWPARDDFGRIVDLESRKAS